MQRWVSGAWQWNGLATKQNVQSVNTVRSSPKTGWWRAGWKPNGKNACAISLRLRRNSSGGDDKAPPPPVPKKKKKNDFSVSISRKDRQPPLPQPPNAQSIFARLLKKQM